MQQKFKYFRLYHIIVILWAFFTMADFLSFSNYHLRGNGSVFSTVGDVVLFRGPSPDFFPRPSGGYSLFIQDVTYKGFKHNTPGQYYRHGAYQLKVKSYLVNYNRDRLSIAIDIPQILAKQVTMYSYGLYLLAFILKLTLIFFATRVLYSLKKGTPFSKSNAVLINKTAAILLVIPVCHLIFLKIWHHYFEEMFNLEFNNSSRPTEADTLCFSLGLLLIVFSYVLKQGVMMKEEQALTI